MNDRVKNLLKQALQVQDACNLSGILYSWADAMGALREAYPDQGTEFYNTHPINVLFASKVADLTGCAVNFGDAYNKAMELTK